MRVVIVQRSLPRYRVPFFEELHARLANKRVTLDLLYGLPEGGDVAKGDAGAIAWARPIKTRILRIKGRELNWQPGLRHLRGADLVIVEQASRLLLNYVLFAKQLLGRQKIALWGHGRNFQEKSASKIGEAIKRAMSVRAHWWFAYNDKSAAVIRAFGFPAERVTVVQNSIDTRPLLRRKAGTTATELSELRSTLGLAGNNVGVFVGGLYEDKRLDFLIQAAGEIRRRVPDFELLIIGGGPQAHLIEAAARENPWIRWVGPRFEEDKVPYILLAKVMVLPYWVGLAVIDSFALEVPLATIDSEAHPPEVDYLVDGVNGLRLPVGTGPGEYADAVGSLLRNESYLERLREGCLEAAQKYTLDEMVERFSLGISKALLE